MSKITIKVIRKKESLNPYKHESKRDWSLNDANNSLDIFQVFEETKLIFESNCQSISNTQGVLSGSDYDDSIIPGKFQIKLFLSDTRMFNCPIHGIIGATTMNGETILKNHMSKSGKGRWLVHDWQKIKPAKPGNDTRVAWSAGCIVLPSVNFKKFNDLLVSLQYKINDVIDVELINEDQLKGETEVCTLNQMKELNKIGKKLLIPKGVEMI